MYLREKVSSLLSLATAKAPSLMLAALFGFGIVTPTPAAALAPEVQAAKDVAETLMNQKVVWHGPTSSPAPIKGKKIAVVLVTQTAEGAAHGARAVVEAGKSVGWKVDVFDGRGDPQVENNAVNAAVDAKYDGIVLVFVDTTIVSDGVKRALDAKIPVITMGTLKNTPSSIPDVSHDYIEHGKAIADYMIWKSDGKVNALLLRNTDLYVAREGQFVGTNQVLTDPKKCPQCKVTVKDWSLANLDSQPASIASATLQAKPDINWVSCFDACLSRVARTLAANGMGAKVKGAGFDCNGENIQLIKGGNIQVVCAADPRDWEGYALVDNLNRMMHGQAVVDQRIPIRMFDSGNVGRLTPEEVKGGWQGDFNFRAKYLELWGIK